MSSRYHPLSEREEPHKSPRHQWQRVARFISQPDDLQRRSTGLPSKSTSSTSEASLMVDAALQQVTDEKDIYVHTIKETDTLPRISIFYGVPLGILRRVNRLSSDEIWFRKTLKIPLPEDGHFPSPEKVATPAEEPAREQGALQAQKISALKKLCPRLSLLGARQLLQGTSWDLWRATHYGEWLFEMTGKLDVDWREALAYLEMYSYDMAKAEEQLHASIDWEGARRKEGCCAPSRRTKEHLSDEEDDESLHKAFSSVAHTARELGPRRRNRLSTTSVRDDCLRDTEMSVQSPRFAER